MNLRRSTAPARTGVRAALAALLVAASGCAPEGAPVDDSLLIQGETMGTTYNVRIATPGAAAEEGRLAAAIADRLEQVNQAMSTYVDSSEVSRLNRWDSSEPVTLTAETFGVLEQAVQLAIDSDGAFDPTVGALVNAWGFGPLNPASAPGEAELAALSEHTGFDLLQLDAEALTVVKLDPAVQVDLSAIAKGYAVDQVSALLDEMGYPSHMVEVGGEVRTGAAKPDGSPWRIGVERPDVGAEELQRLVPLAELAMASSGNYRNFYVMAGRVLGHTIDPRTAQPVDHDGASVSVIAPDCGSADALATVLMVMGPAEGLAWAEERGYAALFIVHEDGEFVERTTTEFRRLAGMAVQ